MIGWARHLTVLIKIGVVLACLVLAVLWPEWRVALQAANYNELPKLCGQTCNPLSSNCSDFCNSECFIDIDLVANVTTIDCNLSTCGEAAMCKATLPDVCIELCGQESNCGKSCTDQNGFTQNCPACPAPKSEFPAVPIVLPPPTVGPSPPPVGPPTPPPVGPPPAPRSDAALSNTFGIPLNFSRNGLYGGDTLFQGSHGAELRQAVLVTAAEFGINPGLLANFLFAELKGNAAAKVATIVGAAAVKSTAVGLDYWGSSLRKDVMRNVPEARDIISTQLPENFTNRNKRNTGPVHEFPNGPTALRAMAATIRNFEIKLPRDREVGMDAWNSFPTATRFEIVRAYYNAGPRIGLRIARSAASGGDIAISSGDDGPAHPQRTATIRAGQAFHLEAVLGNPTQ
jgi:hypothetical protein